MAKDKAYLLAEETARKLAEMMKKFQQLEAHVRRLEDQAKKITQHKATRVYEQILKGKANGAIKYGDKGKVDVQTASSSSYINAPVSPTRTLDPVYVYCIPPGEQIRDGDEVYVAWVWGHDKPGWHVIQALNCSQAIPDDSS